MSSDLTPVTAPFIDSRNPAQTGIAPGLERRQFANSYAELSPEAREMGTAIDAYKLHHRRRFINYEELLAVIRSLGYAKS